MTLSPLHLVVYRPVFLPPYSSMRGYSLLCLSFFCLFVCMVTDFSAAEKGRGVKFCMRVGLLSGQIFSLLVKFGSRESRRRHYFRNFPPNWVPWTSLHPIAPMGIQNWVTWLDGHSELGAVALLRPYGGICVLQACLTHLLFHQSVVWGILSLLCEILFVIFMVALWNMADHYIFALWFLSFFFSSPNLSRRRLDVCHTSTHDVALVPI